MKKYGKKQIKKIISFDNIRLELSGMRFTVEYEITNDGNKADLTLYDIVYTGDERKVPRKSVSIDIDEMIDILNEFDVGRWNKFHGSHPKYVSDGTMFTLEGIVNGEERIYADGSENFPTGFREFEKKLDELLEG